VADEELRSPPYPNEGTTALGLLALLDGLRDWVLHYRDRHNAEAKRDQIPFPERLPRSSKAYESQPVHAQMTHLLFLRRLREQWDRLVRAYETRWDDPGCVRQRVVLLTAAAVVLNTAFEPFETKEMRGRTGLDECRQAIDAVVGEMKTLMEVDPDATDQAGG